MMRRSTLLKTLPFLLIMLVAASWSAAELQPSAQAPTSTFAPAPGSTVTLPVPPMESATPTLPPQIAETRPASLLPTTVSSPTSIPPLPREYFISAITGHHQFFSLGCEAAAAKDWANYFHKDFNEFEFQYRLPLSDNPDLGFVGDVNSPWGQVPPYSYGVYAGPVADLLNAYGIPAKAFKGYTLEQIKAKIAQDKPVIAWVIGNVVGGVSSIYTDSQGNQVVVAAYEHVVIVTGYNETHLRYMTNGKFFDTPIEVFLNSWGVLGNMVLVDE